MTKFKYNDEAFVKDVDHALGVRVGDSRAVCFSGARDIFHTLKTRTICKGDASEGVLVSLIDRVLNGSIAVDLRGDEYERAGRETVARLVSYSSPRLQRETLQRVASNFPREPLASLAISRSVTYSEPERALWVETAAADLFKLIAPWGNLPMPVHVLVYISDFVFGPDSTDLVDRPTLVRAAQRALDKCWRS